MDVSTTNNATTVAQDTLTADTATWLASCRPRIMVAGDAILDTWLRGHSTSLCRETPTPVVEVDERTYRPGGAANTAANVAALGAETFLLTVTGDDHEGALLYKELDRAGVRTDAMVMEAGRHTVVKHRIVADEQMMLRFDDIDDSPIRPCTVRALRSALSELIPRCDAVLIGDYAVGAFGETIKKELISLRDSISLLVVDAHQLNHWAELQPDIVTPNADEAATLLGTH